MSENYTSPCLRSFMMDLLLSQHSKNNSSNLHDSDDQEQDKEQLQIFHNVEIVEDNPTIWPIVSSRPLQSITKRREEWCHPDNEDMVDCAPSRSRPSINSSAKLDLPNRGKRRNTNRPQSFSNNYSCHSQKNVDQQYRFQKKTSSYQQYQYNNKNKLQYIQPHSQSPSSSMTSDALSIVVADQPSMRDSRWEPTAMSPEQQQRMKGSKHPGLNKPPQQHPSSALTMPFRSPSLRNIFQRSSSCLEGVKEEKSPEQEIGANRSPEISTPYATKKVVESTYNSNIRRNTKTETPSAEAMKHVQQALDLCTSTHTI